MLWLSALFAIVDPASGASALAKRRFSEKRDAQCQLRFCGLSIG
jgi:hypothetical protein